MINSHLLYQLSYRGTSHLSTRRIILANLIRSTGMSPILLKKLASSRGMRMLSYAGSSTWRSAFFTGCLEPLHHICQHGVKVKPTPLLVRIAERSFFQIQKCSFQIRRYSSPCGAHGSKTKIASHNSSTSYLNRYFCENFFLTFPWLRC